MPTLIDAPTRIEAAGNKPKIIEEAGVLDVKAGQAVIAHAGEWVRYGSPEPEGAEYVAVCLPAFSPQAVHHD